MKDPDFTYEQVASKYSYDPLTGRFTRNTKWGKTKAGGETGSLSPQGYIMLSFNNRPWPAHRVAWMMTHREWPLGDIDHINRDRSDNRIVNLRMTSRSVNVHNSLPRKGKKFKGVYMRQYVRKDGTMRIKWESSITVDRITYFLGEFFTENDAVDARRFAEVLLGVSVPLRSNVGSGLSSLV